MHLAVVLLTMLALPLASVLIDRAGGGAPTWALVAKWFVFWGAGVRLAIAGVRQIGWPALTASGIFGVTDPRALPLAQELGFWNLTVGALCIASLWIPAWRSPLTLAAALFYAFAGAKHVLSTSRTFEANTAMISDLAIAALLLASWWVALRVR
jgi:hypothetical protein